MAKIDFWIFGYRRLFIEPEDLSLATSILLRASIPCTIDKDNAVLIHERDFSKTQELFFNKINYKATDMLGLQGMLVGIKHKAAILVAIVFSFLLSLVSSELVWDIRVNGNESIPDAAIIYELSECGFSVGDLWMLSDSSAVESAMLSSFEKLSWININRRGTVAYVEVAEKKDVGIDDKECVGYANIVASCDCVIEEITVSSGTAAVKVGDAVKRGDLLISGVVYGENTTEFCYAKGTVTGRMSDRISVSVDRCYKNKIDRDKELIEKELKIFNFPINIFKRYRNLDDECDIIEDVKVFSILGKRNLPFKITSTYAVNHSLTEELYNDAQLVRIASSRLNAATVKRLVDADLVKIKTDGKFTDDGYDMFCDVVFLANVGEVLPFEAE